MIENITSDITSQYMVAMASHAILEKMKKMFRTGVYGYTITFNEFDELKKQVDEELRQMKVKFDNEL